MRVSTVRSGSVALLLMLAACAPTAEAPPELDPAPLRERALETLSQGILFKPSQRSAETLEHELSPLLIRDLAGSTAAPVTRVYWSQDDVTIGGRREISAISAAVQ